MKVYGCDSPSQLPGSTVINVKSVEYCSTYISVLIVTKFWEFDLTSKTYIYILSAVKLLSSINPQQMVKLSVQ